MRLFARPLMSPRADALAILLMGWVIMDLGAVVVGLYPVIGWTMWTLWIASFPLAIWAWRRKRAD